MYLILLEEEIKIRRKISKDSNDKLLAPENEEFAQRRISMLQELAGGSICSFDKMSDGSQAQEDTKTNNIQ